MLAPGKFAFAFENVERHAVRGFASEFHRHFEGFQGLKFTVNCQELRVNISSTFSKPIKFSLSLSIHFYILFNHELLSSQIIINSVYSFVLKLCM